jgi:hypothetical protein
MLLKDEERASIETIDTWNRNDHQDSDKYEDSWGEGGSF